MIQTISSQDGAANDSGSSASPQRRTTNNNRNEDVNGTNNNSNGPMDGTTTASNTVEESTSNLVGSAPEEEGQGPQQQGSSQVSNAVEIPCESAVEQDGEEYDDDDEDDEYEYEEDDDTPFVSGFLVDNPTLAAVEATVNHNNTTTTSSNNEQDGTENAPAKIEDDEGAAATSTGKGGTKWREPTRAAVNMSLRAEQETTGGKRRLAQDLYRIMNQDHNEAGFSLQPSCEDSMDKWTINLFQFDPDSNLAKDMLVLGVDHVELEMSFPDQYPFEPPFVRVVRPRFKKQTGFVMNGALCMELLTKDGWNPVNDIESVIVSIRSLLVVGDGRLESAVAMPEKRYSALLMAASQAKPRSEIDSDKGSNDDADPTTKRQRKNSAGDSVHVPPERPQEEAPAVARAASDSGGSYSVSEAQQAYSHLSDYHKKKGWDSSGWWARKG